MWRRVELRLHVLPGIQVATPHKLEHMWCFLVVVRLALGLGVATEIALPCAEELLPVQAGIIFSMTKFWP